MRYMYQPKITHLIHCRSRLVYMSTYQFVTWHLFHHWWGNGLLWGRQPSKKHHLATWSSVFQCYWQMQNRNETDLELHVVHGHWYFSVGHYLYWTLTGFSLGFTTGSVTAVSLFCELMGLPHPHGLTFGFTTGRSSDGLMGALVDATGNWKTEMRLI